MISSARLSAQMQSMTARLQALEEVLGRAQLSIPNPQLAIEQKTSQTNEPSGNSLPAITSSKLTTVDLPSCHCHRFRIQYR